MDERFSLKIACTGIELLRNVLDNRCRSWEPLSAVDMRALDTKAFGEIFFEIFDLEGSNTSYEITQTNLSPGSPSTDG